MPTAIPSPARRRASRRSRSRSGRWRSDGAAIGGAVGGPVGAVVGAAVGAVAGGLAGKGAAEAVNPTVEDAYWRDELQRRGPTRGSGTYDDYRPAYQYGWESYSRYRGRKFDEVESDLRRDWEKGKANTRLGWDKARVRRARRLGPRRARDAGRLRQGREVAPCPWAGRTSARPHLPCSAGAAQSRR